MTRTALPVVALTAWFVAVLWLSVMLCDVVISTVVIPDDSISRCDIEDVLACFP